MTDKQSQDGEHGTSKEQAFPASLMIEGDCPNYRINTRDHFVNVTLCEVPVSDEEGVGELTLLENNALIFEKEPELENLLSKVYIPPVLDPTFGKLQRTSFLKTGGRTYIPNKSNPLSKRIVLNLKDFGWAKQDLYQEFVIELKGAGTFIEDAGLSISALQDLAKREGNTAFEALVKKLSGEEHNLAISPKSDRGRPKGSQLEEYENYGADLTNKFQCSYPVKFAPELTVRSMPLDVQKRIEAVSKALSSKEERIHVPFDEYVQGIRLTPSTVRGLYLDKAPNDNALVTLIKRISKDECTLEKTTEALCDDAKKFFKVLIQYTKEEPNGRYSWNEVGDVRLAWRDDAAHSSAWCQSEVDRYFNNHDFAWYIAKDLTIAGGSGGWFVDLESLKTGYARQKTSSLSDLKRKHEVSITAIMRDFQRIITQFEIGRRLYSGESIDSSKRRDIQSEVLGRMVGKINENKHIEINLKSNSFSVEIAYPHISATYSKNFPMRQISLRY